MTRGWDAAIYCAPYGAIRIDFIAAWIGVETVRNHLIIWQQKSGIIERADTLALGGLSGFGGISFEASIMENSPMPRYPWR